MTILATLPCRDCPTAKLPVTAHSESDLLAFNLRACAARCEKLGLPQAAAVLIEISAAVEGIAPRPAVEMSVDRPF